MRTLKIGDRLHSKAYKKPATKEQLDLLQELGIKKEDLLKVPYYHAFLWINNLLANRVTNYAHQVDTTQMTYADLGWPSK